MLVYPFLDICLDMYWLYVFIYSLQIRFMEKWVKVSRGFVGKFWFVGKRFELFYLCVLNSGTFGQVLECWDKERKEMVAIKVVRGIKKYREATMIEVDMLQQLGKHDKGGNRWVTNHFGFGLVQFIIFASGLFYGCVCVVKLVYSLQLCTNKELVWLS